ncbi:MAG TPA: hypothetical protein VNI20_11005 [Fimbriimonadaceae bacterium]|nr:hypothetical protein [Fimbriimonadaceae bacterium]
MLAGCAKFPPTASTNFTKRLVISMTVDGKLRSGLEQGGNGLPYVYIIALRLSTDANPTDTGPIPVVVPGGNGFVAGNATHYILWNPLASPQFQIWQFTDSTLQSSFQTGVPINYTQVQQGDKTMQFEIDLSQLVPAADVPTIKSIQINFLTMNNTNTSGGGRLWDALGDENIPSEINRYFTFQLNFANTFTNANTGGFEPQGDVIDPDLDIVDWSVEVRLP